MILYKIELIRSVKGIYSWTIAIEGKEGDEIIGKIADLDKDLVKKYENSKEE